MKNHTKKITEKCYEKLVDIYGFCPDKSISDRLEAELKLIQKRGYGNIISVAEAHSKQIKEDGYLYSLRGGAASSFVNYLLGITDINPLPPHHICDTCYRTEFAQQENMNCCLELPDRCCPICGKKMRKDGFDLAYITFFGKRKKPYYEFCYVGGYEDKGLAGLNLLLEKEPKAKDSFFTRFPLVCENGTLLQRLMTYIGIQDVDLSLLDGKELTERFVREHMQRECALLDDEPVFRAMAYSDIYKMVTPICFSDIVKTDGLACGGGVWKNNAEKLLKNGTATLGEVISCKEDILRYFKKFGVPEGIIFQCLGTAMLRKNTGKLIKRKLHRYGVAEWYIHSFSKIRYLFPKSHHVQMNLIDLKLMWFRQNYPNEYQACVQAFKS